MASRVSSKRYWPSSSRSSNVGGSANKVPAQTRRRQQPTTGSPYQHRNQSQSSIASSSRHSSFAPIQDPSRTTHLGLGFAAEQDVEINEREEDDSLNEVVMALDLRDRGTVGCAYYIAREEKLYMMQDVSSGGIDIIDLRKRNSSLCLDGPELLQVKLHAQPTVILLSTKSDEDVSNHLDPSRGNFDSTAGDGG
ncbi:MAG: hypothetical protein Q9169_003447 [Polycauliona sp. 2 TL-2023]